MEHSAIEDRSALSLPSEKSSRGHSEQSLGGCERPITKGLE